jgi:hypothetical protein
MDAARVFDLRSDPSCDVISLETNRRVSAVLHCEEIPQLLLLNGGAESEQLHVDVVVPAVREPLCFGSHRVEAGKFAVVDLTRPTRAAKLRVRIIGGPKPIVLDEPASPLRFPVARLASAAAFVVAVGSLLLLPSLTGRVAPKPETPPPKTVAASLPHAHPKPRHRTIVAAATAPATQLAVQPALMAPRTTARPPLVAVSTPAQHVVNGEPIAISFKTNGQQVRIVAKIGPRTIEDRIIGASRGKLLLEPPPSSDIRVLTISAMAQNDGVRTSRRAIVILLPDIPTPAVTNL